MTNSRLVVDRGEGLKDEVRLAPPPQNPIIRTLAVVISYIFHPLFIPGFIILTLMATMPQLFAGFVGVEKTITVIQFFVMYAFFPLVTVLLLKGLGFLQSVYLKTQKERIIPYIACGIYYFWMAYVFRNQDELARQIIQLAMAIFIASFFGLMLNIYMKVSMHAISVGTMLAFFFFLASAQSGSFTLHLSGALLVTGLVCTARFIASDHTQREVYLGLLAGALAMIVGVWADGILP